MKRLTLVVVGLLLLAGTVQACGDWEWTADGSIVGILD